MIWIVVQILALLRHKTFYMEICLGFPSEHSWRHVPDLIVDHGLPDSSHLRYDFRFSDSVAQARTGALPFHALCDPDQAPVAGRLFNSSRLRWLAP